MAKVIALSNQKGGVGKTTTAMNLSTCLAAYGKRVLVVDFDPQGNTTTGFNIEKQDLENNSYSLLMGNCSLADAVQETAVPNLFVVPSTVHLSGAEVELVSAFSREHKLKNAFAGQLDDYDYVFIDCPPSLGLLTLNALAAAQEILVPVQCEFFAMEGLSQLFQTVELVKKNLNPTLKISGVLLTMYDKRNNLSALVEKEVREHLGAKVFTTTIPRNVRVSEAPSFGRPVMLYDVKCNGSQAYMKLAAEVMVRDLPTPTMPVPVPVMASVVERAAA